MRNEPSGATATGIPLIVRLLGVRQFEAGRPVIGADKVVILLKYVYDEVDVVLIIVYNKDFHVAIVKAGLKIRNANNRGTLADGDTLFWKPFLN